MSILSATEHHFYIGANVGVSGFFAKTDDEVASTAPELQNLYNNKSIKANGALGGAYLGYILRLHNFGFGTEVYWQYTNLEKTLDGKFVDPANGDDLQFVIKNKLTNQVEFNIKPGYFIFDCFTYAIFGLNLQNMYYSYSATGRRAGHPDVMNFSDKKSRYVRGYTFGAGVQKNIYKNIALGIEFKASKFSERNYRFELPNVPLGENISINSKLKDIQTYSCCLRFMYTF